MSKLKRKRGDLFLKASKSNIVKDGVCIGMYAGINGAKKRIDELVLRE